MLDKTIALASIVGKNTFYRLIKNISVGEAFEASREDLVKAFGVKEISAQRIAGFKDWAGVSAQIRRAESMSVKILCYYDPAHPFKREGSEDFPPVIYIRGNLPPERVGGGVAVVGTRKPDEYASRVSYELARKLALYRLPVVSGMALGVDAEAHKGALSANGATYAVLGTGVDEPYPAQNAALYHRIIERGGAVVSFFPMGTQPLPNNFPARNELIVALSRAVIVVQAGERSGALYTADIARKKTKDLYVVVNDIGKPAAAGSNALLAAGAARPIFDVDETASELAGRAEEGVLALPEITDQTDSVETTFKAPDNVVRFREKSAPPKLDAGLLLEKMSNEARAAYEAVGQNKKHFDEIAAECGFAGARLAEALMELQFESLIEESAGHYYARKKL